MNELTGHVISAAKDLQKEGLGFGDGLAPNPPSEVRGSGAERANGFSAIPHPDVKAHQVLIGSFAEGFDLNHAEIERSALSTSFGLSIWPYNNLRQASKAACGNPISPCSTT